jgi:4-hydroxybenzoate polyprenyltransferase
MQFKLDTVRRKLQQHWRRLVSSRHYQRLRDRTVQYGYLCRLHKPVGIYLLLWPTLWALWIAGAGRPDFATLLVFIAGAVLMRSAGCAINDFADRNIDAHVRRTQDRPLATGKIRPGEAVIVFTVLSLLAFILVLTTNTLTVQLSFVGVTLAAFYPFAKRYTYMPQVVLGATFGWAIPMAFAAQTNSVPVTAWLLFVTNLLWTTAYDTMYAMVDRDDDIKIGVKSTAILFGDADVSIIMFLQGMMLFGLLLTGQRLHLSSWYYAGVGVAACVVIYQYLLIRHRSQDGCLRAFLSNHYLGMAVFLGLLLHYVFDYLANKPA